MQHCNHERLALLALGEEVDDDAMTGHLDSCVRCRTEFTALRRTVLIAREAGMDREHDSPGPPARVWDSIVSELGLASTAPGATRGETFPYGETLPYGEMGDVRDRSHRVGWSGRLDGLGRAGESGRPDRSGGSDRSTPDGPGRRHRSADRAARGRSTVRPRTLWLATAAAAVLGLLGGLALGPWRDTSPGRPTPREQVVATGTLQAFRDAPAVARAEVRVVRVDDRTELRIDASGLPTPAGYYEVWMLNTTTGAMRSMGVLSTSGRTTLPVPPGVDLAQLPEVDVSAEPYDGDRRHSMKSLLRGHLQS